MLGIVKRRREAERQKKLEEQFSKADQNGNGRITAEQMVKIFNDNEIEVVGLEEEVAKLPDKEGWIRLNEYMKYALTTDLCKIEYTDRVFQKVDYGEEEKKKNEAKKESKVKVDTLSHFSFQFETTRALIAQIF